MVRGAELRVCRASCVGDLPGSAGPCFDGEMITLQVILALGLSAAPAADTVAFRFGWPPALTARVEYVRTRTRDGRPPSTLTLRARLVTERRGEELAVRYRDWTGPGKLDPLVEAGGQITTIVTRQGAFARIEGTEPALQALRASMQGVKGAPPDALARLEKMAPAAFTKDASETWSLLVQFWSGSDLEVGEDYQSDSVVPVPALPGETVRIKTALRVRRRLPCPGGAGACVEAWMRSEPDPQDVTRLAKRLVEELGVPLGQLDQALGEMSAVNEAVLVTDPARLLPYRLEKTRTMTVAPSQRAPQEAKAISGRDTTVWTFTYPAASPPRP